MTPFTMNVLLLVGGVGILYIGADWLVRGSSRLATSFGISPIVVGLTVVSFGTSAPELVVALIAALNDNPDLAMGNVMGSNLANIGLILGLTAMIRPMEVARRVVSSEIPIMLAFTALLFPLLHDARLGLFDGLLLFGLLLVYLRFVNRFAQREPAVVGAAFQTFAEVRRQVSIGTAGRDALLVIGGVGALVLGGKAIVDSAEFLARALGVSDVVVGLTVVAIGTSLPELATAVVAALRREVDIAVGNIIGSNIFNIAAILGITSIVTPIHVSPEVITRELPAVFVLSFLILPLTRRNFCVHRWEGGLLLVTYAVLTTWLVLY
ncbi:MAG: calcium/sodium antiporter [Longimicrobiales bacterium]|nr:calcium/sodium antiporter [Longimicrobiales bacterium]